MSNPVPPYGSPLRGEGPTPAVCATCGSPAHGVAPIVPTWACLAYLREQIGTLQGEVLALRRQLAARPLITTYEQLSAATGIPVARLQAQGVLEPEPASPACLAPSPNGVYRCTERQGHRGSHAAHDQYGPMAWDDPCPLEPQTAAEAAIADAAQWPDAPMGTPPPGEGA